MAFVIDASMTGSWAFADEDHPATRAVLTRLDLEMAIVPELWRFEVLSLLIMGERRGRIAESEVTRFLRTLSHLRIEVDHNAVDTDLLALARTRRLSAYDAAYLELALRRGARLATLDARLAEAARAAGVELV